MKLATRLHRSLRVARTALALWILYKPPEYARRLLRRPQPDRTGTHERAARLLLRSALDLRGVIIKMCQSVATRSDVFPPPSSMC